MNVMKLQNMESLYNEYPRATHSCAMAYVSNPSYYDEYESQDFYSEASFSYEVNYLNAYPTNIHEIDNKHSKTNKDV